MNADAITAKIIEDARVSAEKTLSEAKSRAEALTRSADEALAVEQEKSQKQAKKDCAELRDRMLRMAELDQRKVQLAVKREVIDVAFERALALLRGMDRADMRAFLTKILLSAAEGGEEIVVDSEDTDIFDQQTLREINSSLFEQGRMSVTLSGEHRKTGGGFILKQGGMEINCTLPAVLSQRRASLEADAAEMLFR